MSRTFHAEHDRILIIDQIRENRVRRATWVFVVAMGVLFLCFIAGYLGRVL